MIHSPTINTYVQSITPETAKQMLSTSPGNRTVRKESVAAYARAMAAGKWLLNGETVILDEHGHLMDGHHRLHGCVQSGAPFVTMVARGIPRAAFTTINTGQGRNAPDALQIAGVKGGNNTLLAAIARTLFIYDVAGDSGTFATMHGWKVSNQEILEYIGKNPRIVEISSDMAHKGKCPSRIRRAGVGATAYILDRINPVVAVDWLRGVISGEGLAGTDARYVLRERLLDSRYAPSFESFAWCLKSGQAFLDGRAIKTLRLSTNEQFPRMRA